ncbi:DctP family TRAP transporter solute-binding subunit [Radiobacillus kanasensis]|uniref:DctP family TRAP transporter solute-binding subunit n=1 Tax=Radiobacillus kanasensis TaxID=2844358 RepID=UPI001E5755F0|nr:DctP family TRAP transporter solute-binding subunit [Radiobacillus kanasensis]UFT98740.1 DctP family TRAP transporter solute-binding subunit [Radiobacillus kanasensis]
MKVLMWIASLVLVIGLPFVLVYHIQSQERHVVYDDEQNGLNDQIVIKISHVVAENTPKGLAAQRFADLVEQKTNNKVKVEVFPNGSLYSDLDELDALERGSIQMIAPATTKVSQLFPELNLLDLPFAFPTNEAVNQALTGDLGQDLLEASKTDNVIGMAFWNNGFKQVTSGLRPLVKTEDFEDQVFRVMPGKAIESQFQALDVDTEEIVFNLTYRNLENGTITGQENTLSNIYSKKFYEVQDHLTISNHGLLSYIVLMNRPFWDNLSSDIQKAIQESMTEVTAWNLEQAVKMNDQALQKIEEKSDIKVHELTDKEKREWLNELSIVYEEFEPIIGKDWLERVPGITE